MSKLFKFKRRPRRVARLLALAGAATALALVASTGPADAAAPVHVNSVGNVVGTDVTTHRCDATGGHCARLHVVAQLLDGAKLRGYASVQCYLAGGVDFNCASVQGSTWMTVVKTGVDFEGPITSCTPCRAALSAVSPWILLSYLSETFQQGAAFEVVTGAAGGGSVGISTAGPEFTL